MSLACKPCRYACCRVCSCCVFFLIGPASTEDQDAPLYHASGPSFKAQPNLPSAIGIEVPEPKRPSQKNRTKIHLADHAPQKYPRATIDVQHMSPRHPRATKRKKFFQELGFTLPTTSSRPLQRCELRADGWFLDLLVHFYSDALPLPSVGVGGYTNFTTVIMPIISGSDQPN